LSGEEAGFVPLVELVWVLSGSYGLDRAQVSDALDGLLRSREPRLDRADLVVQALRRFSAGGADFAGCLMERIAADAGCTDTMTFDAGAARSAGMRLIGA
jgi:predicted nucleic-acid-binding protein